MKTKLNNILIAIQALAAIVMVAALKIWAPVCGKMDSVSNSGSPSVIKMVFS